MSVGYIAVVQLAVSDLARSKRFYRDALGLRLGLETASRATTPGVALFDFGTARCSLQLQETRQDLQPARENVVVFEVEPGADIAGLLERVIGIGGRIRFREVSGDWLRIGLEDPDQNLLELLIPR